LKSCWVDDALVDRKITRKLKQLRDLVLGSTELTFL
jgi:hypothetical protein